MPYAMALDEEKTPPGTDVLLALLGLASVATSKVLRQTGWIEQYRTEMRAALANFDLAAELAPNFADIHFRRARALRHLGETDKARGAIRRATLLDPDNAQYAALRRILDGAAAVPQRSANLPAHPGESAPALRLPKPRPKSTVVTNGEMPC
jgi:tetratricopeptide (TPR) repeat protein